MQCGWHELNQPHGFELSLLDADGQPVQHPEHGNPVLAEVKFEIGRPPGIKPGSSMTMPFAVPFGAFDLEPGAQYEVRFSLDNEARDEWRLPFTIRDAPPEALAA